MQILEPVNSTCFGSFTSGAKVRFLFRNKNISGPRSVNSIPETSSRVLAPTQSTKSFNFTGEYILLIYCLQFSVRENAAENLTTLLQHINFARMLTDERRKAEIDLVEMGIHGYKALSNTLYASQILHEKDIEMIKVNYFMRFTLLDFGFTWVGSATVDCHRSTHRRTRDKTMMYVFNYLPSIALVLWIFSRESTTYPGCCTTRTWRTSESRGQWSTTCCRRRRSNSSSSGWTCAVRSGWQLSVFLSRCIYTM